MSFLMSFYETKLHVFKKIHSLEKKLQHCSNQLSFSAQISPELSATATLRVVVLDVNDNPPMFERMSYYTTISEAAKINDVVTQVKATSLDIGANAAITYSIAAGNQQEKFTIGPSDGKLL